MFSTASDSLQYNTECIERLENKRKMDFGNLKWQTIYEPCMNVPSWAMEDTAGLPTVELNFIT